MTEKEFCYRCGGYCCNIYDHFIIGTPEDIELRHKSFFKKSYKFDVEPLGRVGNRCEYLGENGCIIKRENRPLQCLNYACDELRLLVSLSHKKNPK